MHIVVGSNPDSSQRVSDRYLEINGAGCTSEEQRDLVSEYPEGRCDYGLLYMSVGSTLYDLGNGYEEIEAGTFILLTPGMPYASILRRDHLENHWWIHFSGTAVEPILRSLGLYGVHKIRTGSDPEILETYEAVYRELLYRQPGFEEKINSLILRLLVFAARRSGLVHEAARGQTDRSIIIGQMWDRRIESAMQSIHVHPERFYSVDELAGMCHVSKYHFIRIFSETTGLTPYRYMLGLKLDKAKTMLAASDLSVTEIAASLGFSDIAVFRRAFVHQNGIPPREYRFRNKQ